MTDPVPPTSPDQPDDKPIGPEPLPEIAPDGTFCSRCGYDVRELPTSGRCPECGTPVAHALCGHLLAASAPSYRARLERGFLLIAIGAFAIVGVSVVSIALSITFSIIDTEFGWSVVDVLENVSSIAQLLYSFVALLGWWMISTPDEGLAARDDGRRVRLLIRGCVIGAAAGTVLELALSVGLPNALGGAGQIIALVTFIARFFAGMTYIRWLAPRIPSAAIHDRAGRYRWLLPVIAVLLACLVVGPVIAILMFAVFMLEIRRAIRAVTPLEDLRPGVVAPGASGAA